MAFYQHEIANSKLYEKSRLLNCDLVNTRNVSEGFMNRQLTNYATVDTSCSKENSPDTEHFLITDQFNAKYRCEDATQPTNPFVDNSLGFAANKGFMYGLDDFNTYHNYPVCTKNENGEACCPKNVQIFRNMTRRNNEIPAREMEQSVLLFDDNIPKLTYNTCKLYE